MKTLPNRGQIHNQSRSHEFEAFVGTKSKSYHATQRLVQAVKT
jgi:hypothetical protein